MKSIGVDGEELAGKQSDEALRASFLRTYAYRVYIIYYRYSRARRAFLAGACLSRFWRATHGFVFLVCRGSNSVNFASLVEVLAAHTAANEPSQVCLCFQ